MTIPSTMASPVIAAAVMTVASVPDSPSRVPCARRPGIGAPHISQYDAAVPSGAPHRPHSMASA